MSGDVEMHLGGGVVAIISEFPPIEEGGAVGYVLERLEHACVDETVAQWPIDPESHQATFHQGLLSVHPGLACDTCGLYGEIVDGIWVPTPS